MVCVWHRRCKFMLVMKNKKLTLSKEVLKTLTPTELTGVVGGDTTSMCGVPGTALGCDSTK